MAAPALSRRPRRHGLPEWRWSRPFALLPLLAGAGLACLVLQFALACCA